MDALHPRDSLLDNPNPTVKSILTPRDTPDTPKTLDSLIFDAIRDIRDPEHPHSLEQLSVVEPSSITIKPPPLDTPGHGHVSIYFTPTVPHCSLASIIGLSIHKKLQETSLLQPIDGEYYYKLHVKCVEGAHAQAADINRQLNDKERVSAAFENPRIITVLRQCIDNLP